MCNQKEIAMNRFKIAFLFTIFFIPFYSTSLYAHPEWVYLRSDELPPMENDELFIPFPEYEFVDSDVEELAVCGIYNRFEESPENREEDLVIGALKVVRTDFDGFYCKFKVTNPSYSYPAEEVFLVRMPVEDNKSPRVFTTLARNRIHLTDVYGNKLFADWDGSGSDQKMMEAFAEDIALVAQELQEELEGHAIDLDIFKGQNLYEIMRDVDAQGVQYFVNYMASKPLIYRGEEWKISEVFATWVVAGAPLMDVDQTAQIWLSLPEENLNAVVSSTPPGELKKGLEWLANLADSKLENGKREEAFAIRHRILRMAEIGSAEEAEAWAWYSIGEHYLDQNDFSSADSCFGNAADHFAFVEPRVMQGLALYNQGLVSSEIDPERSVGLLVEAIEVQEEFNTEGNSTMHSTLGLSWRTLGDAYLNLDDPNERRSEEAYLKAEEFLTPLEDPASQKRLRGTYERLEGLYAEMGKKKGRRKYGQLLEMSN